MGQNMECITVTVIEEKPELEIRTLYVVDADTYEETGTLYVGKRYVVIVQVHNRSDIRGKPKIKVTVGGNEVYNEWTSCVEGYGTVSFATAEITPSTTGSLQICADIVDTERC